MKNVLPYLFEGLVVRGFGRGGKELGCPTANLEDCVVANLPDELKVGVYFGLASLNGKVFSMAMSVGKNPQYKNEKKTLEVNLIGYNGPDFYGSTIRGLIIGFIREMSSFVSLDALKAEIANDIEIAKKQTENVEDLKHQYFEHSKI
ncbi:unnamed protein product [Caenorhabditis angaria]|uniref:riboflavin kinase n=1 Tax=Caenorhabditis angaria TaxID=860376 RepID=A0A9P1N4M5_9PELO|nr:unnamed protein product [Caenorhabditis angaria]